MTTTPQVVLVAHVLAADVRQHAKALQERGVLRSTFTGIVHQPHARMERWLSRLDRTFGSDFETFLAARPPLDDLPADAVHRHLLPELCRLATRGIQYGKTRRNDWVKSRISRLAARRLGHHDRLVVAREMEAEEVFSAARAKNITTLYQLPTSHHATVQHILKTEYETFPDLADQELNSSTFEPSRIDRKNRELAMADSIIVPSEFVRQSLIAAGVASQKVVSLPFACEEGWRPAECHVRSSNTWLHAGQLSVRKGTHRLLKVWKQLGAYRTQKLRLVGSMRLPPRWLKEYAHCFEFTGRVPREELKRYYHQASCFVLPALAEGFANVILESLACGTPVIASRNSGADGFITPGVEGRLHDAQNDDDLAAQIDHLLSRPSELTEMGRNAQKKADTWTWADYRARFAAIAAEVTSRTPLTIQSRSSIRTAD